MADKKAGRFGKPLLLQVRDELAQRIARGEWAAGTALPNEAILARELGVSSGTIAKALGILEAERTIPRRQGRGVFVTDQASAGLAFRYHGTCEAVSTAFRDVECEAGPADETERKRLALDDALGVFRMRRLRLLDGKPYLLEQSCFPGALFPDLLQRVSSPYQLHEVACAYGIVPLLARERASEVAADQAVAVRLQVPAGTPILVLDRVVYSSDRVPIEWRLAKCHLRGAYDHAGIR